MRIAILICCCIALAACTVVPKFKPDTKVTTPAVGHPPPPSSVAAATSAEAFTPYGDLGTSSGDALAPDESFSALSSACLRDAGYPGAASATPIFAYAGALRLSFPWGAWGYLGVAEAEQDGFSAGAGIQGFGVGSPVGGTPSTAEQKAISKCAMIAGNFSSAQATGALAGIATLTNDIMADVRQDPSVKAATRVWSACMKQNGYQSADPQTVFFKTLRSSRGLIVIEGSGEGTTVLPSQAGGPAQSKADKEAEIALAVTDATCTQSSDLAGIYFAVEASYSRQLTDLNQLALNAAVVEYRDAYQTELAKLPQLLK